MQTLRSVLGLLSRRERIQASLLMLMVLVMAALEVAGVASIMPFIAVLANQEVVHTNPYLHSAFEHFGFRDTRAFLFALGLTVFAIFVSATLFKALTTWALSRFTYMREYAIGRRLLEGYLGQPYEWFIGRNSADLGKNVLSEVENVVSRVVIPVMQLFAQGAVAIALLALLVLVNPLLAFCVGAGIGMVYLLTYGILRTLLRRLGSGRLQANRLRFESVNEAFGGFKEIKLGGLESIFLGRFDAPAYLVAKTQAASQYAMNLPRFALEIVAFGGLILITLYLMRTSGSFAGAVPIIALYAFAGYRLLPAFQQIYLYFSLLRFSAPALDALHSDFRELSVSGPLAHTSSERVELRQSVRLIGLDYAYPHSSRLSLHDANVTIPARTTVGLVGATGSGKTTLVDVMLGLLVPQRGEIHVDDLSIRAENIRAWQRCIGYVPQQIFLADDTVAANIAFGVPVAARDMDAVQVAAKAANLHDFVVKELPRGYETAVGERGIRLSGGQRQRIGIARALYRRPELLVMDEATSALDTMTEKAVMDAVHNLRHETTIVLVAHRLSTVRDCDLIYLLENGRVTSEGTFEELVSKSSRFKEMTLA